MHPTPPLYLASRPPTSNLHVQSHGELRLSATHHAIMALGMSSERAYGCLSQMTRDGRCRAVHDFCHDWSLSPASILALIEIKGQSCIKISGLGLI